MEQEQFVEKRSNRLEQYFRENNGTFRSTEATNITMTILPILKQFKVISVFSNSEILSFQ